MGQYFCLVNLDNSRKVKSSPSGKFGEFYCHGMFAGTYLLRGLWNPDEDEKRIEVLPLSKAEGLPFPQESTENLSEGLFNQFSNEVLDIIFGKICNILDLISLMVTCQRYWEFGRLYLEKLLEDSIVVSWAGDRLLLMGDYAELNDLPKGMLTDSEMERIKSTYRKGSDVYRALSIIKKPRRRFSSPVMREISSTQDFVFELRSRTLDAAGMVYRYQKRVYDVLNELIVVKDLNPADFFNGRMVFRNLTTKEYVRGDAIKKVKRINLEFEHVLYIRTTWSSDSNLTYRYNGPLQIHRGIWAGHRFDVTRIGRVVDEAGVAVDGWKDVTDEVLDEVQEIWEY